MAKGHGYHKKRKRNWQPETAPGYASRQKNAHGEGEYPPPHVLANPAFEAYYRESGIVPEAEWDEETRTPPACCYTSRRSLKAGMIGWMCCARQKMGSRLPKQISSSEAPETFWD